MDKLEALEQYIEDNGIDFIESEKLKEKSMILKDCKSDYVAIVINSNNIKNTAEKFVALTHECTHHQMKAYYYSYMLRINEGKIEYDVKSETVYKLIPFARLYKLLKEKSCRYEISEIFGVSEDFIDLAINIYQRKGLLPYWNGIREEIPIRDNAVVDKQIYKPPLYHSQNIPRNIHRSQFAEKNIINHLRYEDYANAMRKKYITCDIEMAAELSITISYLRQERRQFQTQGLPIRQCEIATGWDFWDC